MSIDLVLLTDENAPREVAWALGRVHAVAPVPELMAARLAELAAVGTSEAVLFWDPQLGTPDAALVGELLGEAGDVWHSGLQLGMGGQPGLIDYVASTWMLNRDPPPEMEATSWRISLRACMVRMRVLRDMGGVEPRFKSMVAAALELGHRWISLGVILRSQPRLLGQTTSAVPCRMPFEDELRFIYYRFGRSWTRWALVRAVLSGYVAPFEAIRASRRVLAEGRPVPPRPYAARVDRDGGEVAQARVSVLIPTLDRYPYLRTVLHQLSRQTVLPLEVLVIDQTAPGEREMGLADEFPDLPLVVCHQEQPGQCSSRNRGLQIAQGDYVLFLDDDDEIEPDLIERHLRHLGARQVPVSCGVAHEVGAGPLPENFTYARISDVFPTNNTMILRSVLEKSGLFDLAYDRGQRADADLGMRVYLSGACMLLDPGIAVLHHHAPRGGLRVHKARVITYASSRQRLTHRHLPSVSEIYLANRYFTPRQVREALWHRALGTLSARGPRWKRALKVLIGLVVMPRTLWQMRHRYRQADAMRATYPSIPALAGRHLHTPQCETVL